MSQPKRKAPSPARDAAASKRAAAAAEQPSALFVKSFEQISKKINGLQVSQKRKISSYH